MALIGPGAHRPELPDAAEAVCCTSGYEAAAELLIAPASALLVDLGRITRSHVRLLDLAGRVGVPVVAFGAISATLSGATLATMRLVSAENVSAALAEVLSAPGVYEPTERDLADGPTPPGPQRPAERLTRAELDALIEENQ